MANVGQYSVQLYINYWLIFVRPDIVGGGPAPLTPIPKKIRTIRWLLFSKSERSLLNPAVINQKFTHL